MYLLNFIYLLNGFHLVYFIIRHLIILEGARASTGLTLCVDVSSGESYKWK